MSAPAFSPNIGIYGHDRIEPGQSRGCALWPAGYAAAITEAGGAPFALELPQAGSFWNEPPEALDGVLFLGGFPASGRRSACEERLCLWCQDQRIPFLGVDQGLHALNAAHGGTLHTDLRRELPQALQHQHVPEPGDRHAILVTEGTKMARFYGEGEIVVNSEHLRAINKVGRGFIVSARALDGVSEAIEYEGDDWFAIGVQWHPASASASGLDIQLFRGFIDACKERHGALAGTSLVAA
jgi:putative glutamine amidotransferase